MTRLRQVCGWIATLLPAICVAAQSPTEPAWARIRAPHAVAWPRDHGAHPNVRTEWWYATGELADATGERFGYQLTIFRHGLQRPRDEAGVSRLRASDVYAAHLSVMNVRTQARSGSERVRRAAAGLAGARTDDLDVWIEDWTIARRADGRVYLSAFDRELQVGVDLALEPTKPPVMHGADGVSQKGPEDGNASAYMSWTRLATTGAVTFAGERRDVGGESWFDHEWGTSQLGAGVVGWDWFGLRMDDGRELMLYRLRGADGAATPFSGGTLVGADGTTRTLARDDADVRALAHWTSPRTRARYPVRWRIVVPTADVDVEVRARVDDAEVDGRASTGTIYWEGPVSLEGSISGAGYAELTGYAGSLAERF